MPYVANKEGITISANMWEYWDGNIAIATFVRLWRIQTLQWINVDTVKEQPNVLRIKPASIFL